VLHSTHSGKNLRINPNGTVDAKGGNGPLVKFVIDPSPNGYLRLKSAAHPAMYLAIRDGQLTAGRQPGERPPPFPSPRAPRLP
jgi:hypothetical protein